MGKETGLEGFLNGLADEIMKGKPQDVIDRDICMGCREPITGFRDRLSAREYVISGLCQACQDEVFGLEEDE